MTTETFPPVRRILYGNARIEQFVLSLAMEHRVLSCLSASAPCVPKWIQFDGGDGTGIKVPFEFEDLEDCKSPKNVTELSFDNPSSKCGIKFRQFLPAQ